MLLPSMVTLAGYEGLVGHPTSLSEHRCAAASQNVLLQQIVLDAVERDRADGLG